MCANLRILWIFLYFTVKKKQKSKSIAAIQFTALQHSEVIKILLLVVVVIVNKLTYPCTDNFYCLYFIYHKNHFRHTQTSSILNIIETLNSEFVE